MISKNVINPSCSTRWVRSFFKSSSSIPYYEPLCIQIIKILPGESSFLQAGANDSPSQALPRQLSRRESQAVKFVAKALGEMRKFPAVGLPLPLGEVDANAVSRRRGRRTRETPPVCCADSPLGDGAFGIVGKSPAKVQSFRALYLSAPGNVLYYKNKKSVRFLRRAQKALRTTR